MQFRQASYQQLCPNMGGPFPQLLPCSEVHWSPKQRDIPEGVSGKVSYITRTSDLYNKWHLLVLSEYFCELLPNCRKYMDWKLSWESKHREAEFFFCLQDPEVFVLSEVFFHLRCQSMWLSLRYIRKFRNLWCCFTILLEFICTSGM